MRHFGHAGKGPKGYKRSDENILEDINLSLMENPEVDAENIEIMVKNGEVELTGIVEDRFQKRVAQSIAEDVMGVIDVHNGLKLKNKPNLPAREMASEHVSLIKGMY